MAVRFVRFQIGLVLAAALSALALPTAGRAYTPDEQQACSGDAFRLCSAEIPDVDRITVCMVRNKSQLSPGCRAFFRPDPEPAVTPVPVGRPIGLNPASTKKQVSARSSRRTKPARPDAN
jgi:hypothetical protein